MRVIGDLSHLSDDEFEARRQQIIRDHIASVPENQRKKIIAFQMALDLKRGTIRSEAFIEYCFKEVGKNLEQMSELFEVAGAMMGLNEPSLPDYTNEREPKI